MSPTRIESTLRGDDGRLPDADATRRRRPRPRRPGPHAAGRAAGPDHLGADADDDHAELERHHRQRRRSRATASTTAPRSTGPTTQTTYTFTGLVCGTNYALGLTAIDAAGNESYRPEAVASPRGPRPATPTPTPTRARRPTAPPHVPARPDPTPTPPEPTPTATAAPDRTPPAVPQGLITSATQLQTTITLSWNATTDNVGVTGYRLYNGTTLVGHHHGLTYTFTGLACGTDYALGLTAVDAAGNESYRPEAVA